MVSQIVPRILRMSLFLAVLTVLAVVPASATVFTSVTQSGTFTSDDQNVQYTFTVPTAQTLYFYTTSYAGGRNANGTTAPEGGFDPYLALFKNDTVTDSTGTHHGSFLNENDDANDGNANYYNRPDSKTGVTFDSFISTLDNNGNALSPGYPLAAGSYILALTEFDNVSVGYLSDGFSEDGNKYPNGDFTQANGPPGTTTGAFYDTSNIPGTERNGNYTFNISATAPSAPEPAPSAALGLFGLALGGLILTARRRNAAAK